MISRHSFLDQSHKISLDECMNDHTFDEDTALQWIEVIEASQVSIRDNDIYPAVRSWLSDKQITKVLEIGSGQGICSDKIDFSRLEYTGVEPSPLMTKRAKKIYSGKNREFVLGNAYSLPFLPDAFDGCFSILVWHLLSDLRLANQELSRVLKPGGHFLIITANPGSYSAWKRLYSSFKMQGKRFEGTMQLTEKQKSHDVLFLHEHEELLSSLRDAGLACEKTQTFRQAAKENVDLLICIEGRKL
jgi:SAM-dependent methyltransferase